MIMAILREIKILHDNMLNYRLHLCIKTCIKMCILKRKKSFNFAANAKLYSLQTVF